METSPRSDRCASTWREPAIFCRGRPPERVSGSAVRRREHRSNSRRVEPRTTKTTILIVLPVDPTPTFLSTADPRRRARSPHQRQRAARVRGQGDLGAAMCASLCRGQSQWFRRLAGRPSFPIPVKSLAAGVRAGRAPTRGQRAERDQRDRRVHRCSPFRLPASPTTRPGSAGDAWLPRNAGWQ